MYHRVDPAPADRQVPVQQRRPARRPCLNMIAMPTPAGGMASHIWIVVAVHGNRHGRVWCTAEARSAVAGSCCFCTNSTDPNHGQGDQ
jgi:hypothetical protein